MAAATPVRALTSVFINEIHYDNTGTDAGEAIEIAGPAGAGPDRLVDRPLQRRGGAVYDTDALSDVIPDQQDGFGTVVLSIPGQRHSERVTGWHGPGRPGHDVVQFLSYEGTFTAVGGPANGMLSPRSASPRTAAEPLGQSLQLQGGGTTYEDFTWSTARRAAALGDQHWPDVLRGLLPVATCGAPCSPPTGIPATRERHRATPTASSPA